MMLAAWRTGGPESRLDAVDLGPQRRLKSTKRGLNPKSSGCYLVTSARDDEEGSQPLCVVVLE